MFKKIAQIFTYLAVSLGFAAPTAFAQSVSKVDPVVAPFTDLGVVIRNFLSIIFFVAGLLAFVYLLLGGLQWITSGGDKMAATAARDKITSALVGLIIIVAAFAITLILEKVFGIRIISGVTFPPSTGCAGC